MEEQLNKELRHFAERILGKFYEILYNSAPNNFCQLDTLLIRASDVIGIKYHIIFEVSNIKFSVYTKNVEGPITVYYTFEDRERLFDDE